jgi:hypothetical protein
MFQYQSPRMHLSPGVVATLEARHVRQVDGQLLRAACSDKCDNLTIRERTSPIGVDLAVNRGWCTAWLEVGGRDTEVVLVDVDESLADVDISSASGAGRSYALTLFLMISRLCAELR